MASQKTVDPLQACSTKSLGSLNVTNADALKSHSIKLISNSTPSLDPGLYTVRLTQPIAVPSGKPDTMSSEQQFIARVPQLRLGPTVAIDSVSPAPGQSEHANTLPHVVFKNAELPWERPFSSASVTSFNRMTWIGLLTFTEDELEVPTEYLRKWKMTPHQGVTYTSSVKAGDLREPKASGLLSPVQKMEGNFKDNDMVDCLMVKPDLIKKLFGSYKNGASTSSFNGKPDIGAFAHLAHIRSTHSNTTTSISLGDTESKVSLLMGHRVAPIGLEQPTTMISHVVSLEGIDKLEFSDDSTEYIGLVSLHSWTWTALPTSDVDFIGTMENLAKSIQPLRTKKEVLDPLTKGEPANETALWVYKQLQDGYSLKPYTAITGEATTALFRGPFTPTFPSRMGTSARTWSTSSTDLAIVDPKTGIVNVSYQFAWQLGHQLGTSDATFSMSLLRLRSRMATGASKQVREKAHLDFAGVSEFISPLSSAASNVVEAEKSENVQVGKINSTLLWGDGWPHFLNASLDTGSKISEGTGTPQYHEQIENMAPILTRARGSANIPQSPYNQGSDTNSHDWANVLPWITDVLLTNKVPLQYLSDRRSRKSAARKYTNLFC
ncbi:hypothetical protein GGS24DRAFT_197578 [Hypoxylon argillaceum]|nr:hypothetical protein GGS24DRAFT_197578 [Hypoxylon argillaceum]